MTPVWTWSWLTASSWNQMIDNLNSLNSRVWWTNWLASYYTTWNVGIGTNAPGYPLDVVWNIYASNGVIAGNTLWTNDSIRKFGTWVPLNFRRADGTIEMIIDSAWKVWIWTSTPTDTLTVNGWITSTTGWSTITPNTWWTTSNAGCRRIGSFLQIKWHVNYTSGNIIPSWSTVIWTLPVECRPSVGIYIPSTCWSNTNIVSACLGYIDTNGVTYIYTSSSIYYFSFAWTFPAN